jgi:hypothetical protein
MVEFNEFRDLKQKEYADYTTNHVSTGIPIPKTRRIELFSPDEWEEFSEEWASSLEHDYFKVVRFAGSGDKGLDVVGFISNQTFQGGWDNYQCKHYDHPLRPSDIYIEIGKIIFYSYSDEYLPPRKHYFVGSKGIGTSLARLLADPERLKNEVQENWAQNCEKGISSNFTVPLIENLKEYFDSFDFSIFSSKTAVELINGHSKTPFHSVRFGGGVPIRPEPEKPPSKISPSESRYIQQIFKAYTDHIGEPIENISSLNNKSDLKSDFLRQRERFYHAESLRNFARDTVPEGTFETLQEDIYQGVVDICESEYNDGLARMRATLSQSVKLPVTFSPLSSVTKNQDKQGICHQLVNIKKLIWMKGDDNA